MTLKLQCSVKIEKPNYYIISIEKYKVAGYLGPTYYLT